MTTVRSEILAQFAQVAHEQNKELAVLTDSLPLLDSGLDSLCLAVIVARLEDSLGVDPFNILDGTAFPITLGDFVRLYENAIPAR
jgi:acyl carrier protein